MSLVGDFWTHPNILYHYGLADMGFGPEAFKAIQDDLASIVVLSAFSVIQCYLSFCIVLHLSERQKLPRHLRRSPKFSVVAVIVFILDLVALVLAIVAFSTKLFGAAKLAYYLPEDQDQITSAFGYSCVLPELLETCPLFYTNIPSPIASRLDTALGAVLQAVVILADGLLLYRCFVIFRDKPWLYGTGGLVYLASIVIPFVFAGLVYTYSGPDRYPFNPVQLGFGDVAISLNDIEVGTLKLLHVLILSIASSVLVNVLVTGAIAFRVIQAKRRWSKLKTDLVDERSDWTIGKTTVLTILLEAALPPAILGVIICAMSVSKLHNSNPTYTHFLRVLWVSLTALAPQLIAVRVAQGKTWEQQEESVVSRPLQFAMETVRSPRWLDLESPKPVRFRRLSARPQVDSKYSSERYSKAWHQ
ncbi:hypothetical protein BKA70DRAFT_1572149 [Coprinopsis sp. MPI-PUGE-AT-0042]|nr:hypothetical protein BKA70DRAFT_1572149 [Coprinopsis sp. MPI-PUGE-AT-0042]